MEFSTDNLKSLAQQLAEIVSAEFMNAEEDVTVRDLETGLRRRLQEMGRLALGEVLSQAMLTRHVTWRVTVAGCCSTNVGGAPRCCACSAG